MTETHPDIVIKFASTENSFVYNEGVNKGHTLSYSKVNRCLFLSPGAKQLYHNVSEYAYNDKRDCFPSQAALRLQLGWSKPTLKDYTDELRAAGLITVTQKHVGATYNYHLVELHMVPILAHSETVYEFIEPFKYEGDDLLETVSAYRESDLFRKAENDPTEYREQIREWIESNIVRVSSERLDRSMEKLRSTQASEQITMVLKPMSGIPNLVLPNTAGVERSASPEDKPKRGGGGKRSSAFKDMQVEDWNTNHYLAYFESKYLEKLKLPTIIGMKERGIFARLLALYETAETKGVLKEKIDIYIREDFFTPKGISGFCSSMTQGYLDMFLLTGSFERGKQSKLVPVVDEDDEMEQLLNNRNKRLQEG
jgi:hypothetical protein